MTEYSIIGCGDVGRRIAAELMHQGASRKSIFALTRGPESAAEASKLGIDVSQSDFDTEFKLPPKLQDTIWSYLVPPQPSGLTDLRSRQFLQQADQQGVTPRSIVLISTTGVYGDAGGEWVDENTPAKPLTERGQRRLSLEQQWQAWAGGHSVRLTILRVPGIYSNSRIPIKRLQQGTPVVNPDECGFSNRIHADDLARVVIAASEYLGKEQIFNATDGAPGKISEYLQTAAKVAGLSPLPEISMAAAQQQLSPAMLSYLSESRKISNTRMLEELCISLHYPDFRVGLNY